MTEQNILEDDRREEARIENLEYREACREENHDEYWEPEGDRL